MVNGRNIWRSYVLWQRAEGYPTHYTIINEHTVSEWNGYKYIFCVVCIYTVHLKEVKREVVQYILYTVHCKQRTHEVGNLGEWASVPGMELKSLEYYYLGQNSRTLELQNSRTTTTELRIKAPFKPSATSNCYSSNSSAPLLSLPQPTPYTTIQL